jgi:hypothetical protein
MPVMRYAHPREVFSIHQQEGKIPSHIDIETLTGDCYWSRYVMQIYEREEQMVELATYYWALAYRCKDDFIYRFIMKRENMPLLV